MIWSIVSKAEVETYGASSVIKRYKEAVGCSNITQVVVEETDKLDFVKDGDIVLLRTASKQLIETIAKKGVKTTAEDFSKYELAWNKKQMGDFLRSHEVNIPRQFQLSEVKKVRFTSSNLWIAVIV